MRIIYVAGPYRAPTESGVWANIMRARAAGIAVWQAGAVAVVPHLNTMLMGGLLPDHVWLDGAKEILRRCDAVLLVEGWEFSAGSRAEVDLARSLGLPVFEAVGELEVWLGRPRVNPDECPGHERGGTGPPCCDRAGEYNGFASGPLFFRCPKGCSCHD